MADLLIKIGDSVNSDITKDAVGCYKHGDIIEVGQDGEYDDKPWLTVIKVPSVSYKDMLIYMDSSYTNVLDKTSGVEKRRRYQIPDATLKPILSGKNQIILDKTEWATLETSFVDKQ